MGIFRFFVCLLLLALGNSSTHALDNGEFTYEITEDGAEITGCVDICPKNMIIPNQIDSHVVKKISADSFYQSDIDTVVIATSITSIGSNAFASNNLSEVILPPGLQSMGDGAFQHNILTNVVLSEGISSIANYLFKGNQLQGIDLPDSVIDIGWHAFLDNPGKIGENFTYFRVNDDAIVIGCGDICPQNLVIPSQIDDLNVTTIQEYAFGGVGIHTLVLPDTIELVNGSTFTGNNDLTQITIGNPDALIGSYAFTGSSGLIAGDFRFLIYNDAAMIIGCREQCQKQLSIPNNIDGYDVKYIGDGAFGSQEISDVILPNEILKIGSDAFKNNELTKINLPSSLISIGSLAFNSNQIETLIIPSNVNNLGHWSFQSNNISQVSFLGDKPIINQGAFDANDISNVTYCQSATAWDNSTVYGISPVPDCDSDGVLDSMDLEPTDSSISFRVALAGNDGFTQFDPETGSNAIVLSDENLTVSTSKSSEAAESFPILSKDSISAGKHYWEIEAKCGPDSLGFRSGLIRLDDTLTDAVIWSVGSDGYRSNGQWLGSYGESTVSGDIFNFAVDLDSGYLFIGKNGVWSNNSDPEQGLNPIYSDLSGPVFARVDLGLRECQRLPIVANFGNREFNHKVPQGYYKGFCPSGECVVADYGNDTDQDGLPNDYETANGLNPVDASDAQSDSDMDGLTALEEFNLGTSTTNDDTDRDTLHDGWEVDNGMDPLIADYMVSAGTWHSCALDDTGVVCWGRNGDGQTDVPTLSNPMQVSVGYTHSCALDDTGVVCWGKNNHGQTDVPSLSNPTHISMGSFQSCALDDTGVVCWGNNDHGQIDVPTLSNPTQVSVGFVHSCALDDTGVVCWGSNSEGQTSVPSLSNPIKISSGNDESCALDDTGVVCWGFTDYGNTNMPSQINITQHSTMALGGDQKCLLNDASVVCWGSNLWGQLDVPTLHNPTQISVGASYACALDDTGVVCWGRNNYGQTDVPELTFLVSVDERYELVSGSDHNCFLGNYEVICWGANDYGQIDVPTLSNPRSISLGRNHSCALDDSGVVCWGLNDDGQTTVPSLSNPTQISLGVYHTCALDDSGVVCWGSNDYGQVDVPWLINPRQVSLGPSHSCALDDTGVVCWGYNETGQYTVPLLSNPTQFFMGGYHSCALDDTGLVCWGNNYYGQTDVPSLSNPKQVFLGGHHSCALDDTGLVCWGWNQYGQTDVPPLMDPKQWSMGDKHSCAIDDAGVVCWGYNGQGQIDVPEFFIDYDGDERNESDAFPFDPLEWFDADHDGIGDNGDNCLETSNSDQLNTDSDPFGNACDDDNDNDGLPNDYETANGLNPVDASDAQSDSDMDGLTALEEYNLGTSPTNNDTDRDTLPDGWEVENGRDPLVADYKVWTGPENVCAKDDSGIVCWGMNDAGQNNVPILANPSDLSIGSRYICAIDDTGVVCWGDLRGSNIPELINPTSIFLYQGTWTNRESCAIDERGLVCWSSGENQNLTINDASDLLYLTRSSFGSFCGLTTEGIFNYNCHKPTNGYPNLSNPTEIAVAESFACAIADNGIQCWQPGWNSIGAPQLAQPYQLVAGQHHICALYSSGARCWMDNGSGWNDEYGQAAIVIVDEPIQISAENNGNCVLDKHGVVCWGDSYLGNWNGGVHVYRVPGLVNPKQIFSGPDYSCALDESDIVCWSGMGNTEELFFDADGDGYNSRNGLDVFPYDSNEWSDSDADGIGNNTDLDDDNDGFEDTIEIQNGYDPLVANLDIDNDGIANELDTDNDNDGSPDTYDAFPLDANEQIDSDADGIGDNADADNDNDGVINSLDLFPLDAFETADSDGDGVGDNADFFPNSAEYSLDSDLDQMPDAWERKYGLNPTDASDALLDQDNDGLTALEEYEAGTIPLKILDIDANGSVDALTDGLIILRYLFGLRGDNLVNSATASDAMRNDAADVEAYIESLMPGS